MWGLFCCIVGEDLPQTPIGQTARMFVNSWEIFAAGLAVWWKNPNCASFFILKMLSPFCCQMSYSKGVTIWMAGCQLACPCFNWWFLKHSLIWSNFSSPQVFKCSRDLQRDTYQCPQDFMEDVFVFYLEWHNLLEQSLVSLGLRFLFGCLPRWDDISVQWPRCLVPSCTCLIKADSGPRLFTALPNTQTCLICLLN